MPAITTENVAQMFTKIVAAQALPMLIGNLIMAQLVNRDYQDVLGQVGDVVNIPITPVMAANNIAETGTVQLQTATPGSAQIALNTHAEASFRIPDMIGAINGRFDWANLYMKPAILALAEKLEGELLSFYAQFGNTAGSSGASIDEGVVDTAEKKLFAAKAPQGVRKVLVLHQDPYSTVRQISRFTEMQKVGTGQSIVTGTVGQLKDFDVYRSQYAKLLSGPIYHGLAFSRDSIGLAIRKMPPPLPGTGAVAEYVEFAGYGMRVLLSYDKDTLAQQFTVDMLYGAAVLRPELGVDVISNA